ncbi:MAG TPA: type II toxin-antitoxin system HicA family toxin [Tepidisphaeraceae bacterium]|jgi:predicted RNA binding protein YcfA (HicA-like mRNA interferase family)
MPSLPVISGREAVRAFERDGWQVMRQRGSHIVLSKPDVPVNLSIPDHKELDRGTLRKLIRLAGLSNENFAALL